MNWASISCAIRVAILTVVTTSLAMLFTFDTGAAKNNKMTVKFSPEYTRKAKGSGTIQDSKVVGRTKQSQPQVTKTPSPGGPVAIPYPN
jgi:hypothetical protein